MPFTVNQLAEAGKVGLDFYVKNKPPVDQINVDRPLLTALRSRQSSFPGAKEYVVEQLRARYDSNFQWYRGSGAVTYNERNTIEQVKYPWRSAHDGLMIDEDRLSQNGIIVTDDRNATASDAERIQLTNLLTEQSEVLDLGFEQKFSAALHLDGSQSPDAIAGLDFLLPITAAPTAAAQEVVGGLDRYTYPFWLSNRKTGLTKATIIAGMEDQWRECVRHGGKPNKILAGEQFIDTFQSAATDPTTNGLSRYLQMPATGGSKIDPSVTGLAFRGVPIEWAPEFDDNFDGMVSPSVGWTKRCYMLNLRDIKLRPLDGQDMVSRKPPRPHDRYVMYMALTWKGALTMNRSKSSAALAIS